MTCQSCTKTKVSFIEKVGEMCLLCLYCVHPAIRVVAQLYTEKEQWEGQGANEVKVKSSQTNDTPRTSVGKNNGKCREPMINR